jgi:hypothetical protein
MKVAYNPHGAFILSKVAEKWLLNHGCKFYWGDDIVRHNPILIECIETLGRAASVNNDEFVIVNVDSDRYRIIGDNYEVLETPADIDWISIDTAQNNNEVVFNSNGLGLSLSKECLEIVGEKNPKRHDAKLLKCVKKFEADATDDGSDLWYCNIIGNTYRILVCDDTETIETPKTIKWIKI